MAICRSYAVHGHIKVVFTEVPHRCVYEVELQLAKANQKINMCHLYQIVLYGYNGFLTSLHPSVA